MNQDELKALVGQAALQYVAEGQVVGVGTGSTVNKFIDALASMKARIPVASGALFIDVPNYDALTRRVLGPRWGQWDLPDHVTFFTSATLGDDARHPVRGVDP